MIRARRTLASRIMLSYVAFALLVAVVFGAGAAAFLYGIEDQFFEQLLADEAVVLDSSYAASGTWARPRYHWMTVHTAVESLPSDIRDGVRAEPRRREFRGEEGRHYHLRPLMVGGGAQTPPAAHRVPRAWLVAEVHEQLFLRPQRRFLLTKWLMLEAAMLVVALGIAVVVARRISRPLALLAQSVRELDPAAPTAWPDAAGDREIAVVAQALNDLQQRVAGFVAREQAFTRDVGHELRTPLAVIRSTASRLHASAIGEVQARPGLERILAACDRLEWAMRSLLELATEQEVRDAQPATAVRPVFEEAVLELEEALAARRLTLESDIPASCTLPATRPVLHIVLGNVLGNVCAHSALGTVRVWWHDGALHVANPVDLHALPDVERLGVSGVRRDQSPGHGFGLELSRRLCERRGLSLDWRLEASEFRVRLGTTA